MGCGVSATSSDSPTKELHHDKFNNEDDKFLREIHEAVEKKNHPFLQSQLFPLSRDQLLALNRRMMGVHRVDIGEKLGGVWSMAFSQNLFKYQIKSLKDQNSKDIKLVVDVLVAASDQLSLAKDLKAEYHQLGEICEGEQNLISFVKEGRFGADAKVQLTNGAEIHLNARVPYITNRINELLKENDVMNTMFLVLARREIDLSAISKNYESQYFVSFWDCLATDYPHAKLLDLSNSNQENDKGVLQDTGQNKSVEHHQTVDHLNHHETVEEAPITGNSTEPEPSVEDCWTKLSTAATQSPFKPDQVFRTFAAVLSHSNTVANSEAVSNCLESEGDELVGSLKDKFNEETMKTVRYLVYGYTSSSSSLLHHAITENDQSTVDLVLMVLLCSTPSQLSEIATKFSKNSDNETLSDVLSKNLLGEFQRFVAAIFKENRDVETETDENKAKEDARRLHEATNFTWDGEDNVFSEVFSKGNFEQLQLTFKYFHQVSGQDITELILQEFTYHLQKALLNIVYIANNGLIKFLAKFVYESKSKSHFGIVLMWTIAARYKIDLKEVSSEYEKKYNSPITDLILGSIILEENKIFLTHILCSVR